MARLPYFLTMMLAAACIAGAEVGAGDAVPQTGPNGVEGFSDYRLAGPHKAFVIAPGGVWAWRGDMGSAEAAVREAKAACSAITPQPCLVYAEGDEVVLDRQGWAQVWRPYTDPDSASAAQVGQWLGDRFPDLAFRDPEGKERTISDYRGQVVVLHFWGSWCPPCVVEMPEMQAGYNVLRDEPGVTVILLQMREPIAKSQAWAGAQGYDLPLFDSGVAGFTDRTLRTRGGGPIDERELAPTLPTTYVLDRSGIVLFAHSAPVYRWQDYLPQIRDAVARSGPER